MFRAAKYFMARYTFEPCCRPEARDAYCSLEPHTRGREDSTEDEIGGLQPCIQSVSNSEPAFRGVPADLTCSNKPININEHQESRARDT